MATNYEQSLSTGLPGLDRVLKGVMAGDNIVWQVDAVEDYAALVRPFAEAAVRRGRKLIYFRFASHSALLPEDRGAQVHELHPEEGFEAFLDRIHRIIEEAGRGAFYVFDCLSELAADWYSDQMLGNFFMLTCPYLYDLETVTYFALFRNAHSRHSIGPIRQTTQLLLDVYRHHGILHVRPVKVQHRYSPTMNMLHAWKDDDFKVVTCSAVISEILTASQWSGLRADQRPGFWDRAFLEAQEVLDLPPDGSCPRETERDLFRRLVRMVISRDEGIEPLIEQHLSLQDILEIRRRMIGTGLIGGKTVGMLLARAILKRSAERYAELLEEHDSFFIGSDVFYTFLVRNGIWWTRQKQRDPEAFLDGSEQARRRILTGGFPDYTLRQLEEMLDYFGQAPFIVRSSSLLEDNFGNAFAGKYESVFCANQGPRDRRLEDLLAAIRTVYASTMGEKALRYRAQRGLLDRDEQMALLVMRVSGALYGRGYYPPVAGVGFSFNPYVWNPKIDPKAGVLRLVYGLGTRAVDRADDDYTRLVALNAPNRRPEANFDEVRQYAQRRVDYIDLDANRLVSGYYADIAADAAELPQDLFAATESSSGGGPSLPANPAAPVLTFDGLLGRTQFVEDMRGMLRTLQAAYDHPVDIEFTANFPESESYRINLVQCRPLQVRGADTVDLPKVSPNAANRIIEARGAVVGQGRVTRIDRFVYVVPERYGALTIQERYEVARLLGDLNRRARKEPPGTIMLLGPGRWGTSSPELGIPVNFAEISESSVLCEIVAMRKDLVPDVSLGTHFLNELVEMDMLYLALFPDRGGNYLDREFFEQTPSRLLDLLPAAEKWKETVRVIDAAALPRARRAISLTADTVEQKVLCYRETAAHAQPAGGPPR